MGTTTTGCTDTALQIDGDVDIDRDVDIDLAPEGQAQCAYIQYRTGGGAWERIADQQKVEYTNTHSGVNIGGCHKLSQLTQS